jgi:pyrroline-5-carboxylate reductase
MQEKIGIIGFGNMGSAIAERIKTNYQIFVFDKDKNKINNLKDIGILDNGADLVKKCEVVILAIKPQDFAEILREIKNYVKGKLIISIAAGIGTTYIERILGDIRVIRVMPNIGARIGESVTCLSKGTFASEEDFEFTDELFNYLGQTKRIEEKMMNAATAICGSGPAYIFDFIQLNSLDAKDMPSHTKNEMKVRLQNAAEALGFNHDDAIFLAVSTIDSSLKVVTATRIPPADLVTQVASKGGTTEAALLVLHKGGTWEDAAKAALRRAEELSRG